MLRRCRWGSSFFANPCLISVLSLFLFGEQSEVFSLSTGKSSVVVSVCQNKDCCQNFGLRHANLVQTLERLLPTSETGVTIEATGCQSKCDLGPNLMIDGKKTFNGVRDVQAAAVVLEMAVNGLKIPSSLLAASTVMEKANLADSSEKKEKFLDSVIKVLQNSPDTAESVAIAHAHAMRAEVRLDSKRPKEAVDDAELATEINPSHPTAWRTLADAQEASGDIAGAIHSLSKWAAVNPQFSTKINKEKARLSSKAY